MKSHCINGHAYNDETIERRKNGSFACRTCRQHRQNYYKAAKAGREVEKPTALRLADRIVDLLLVDGGWLTCAGIAVALDLNEETVRRTLYRLRRKGYLEERVIEMACSTFVSRNVESRREWRHAQAFEAWAS